MSNQEFIERLYSEIVSERELREDAEAKAALCVETHAKQLASLREENYALRKTHEMMLKRLEEVMSDRDVARAKLDQFKAKILAWDEDSSGWALEIVANLYHEFTEE